MAGLRCIRAGLVVVSSSMVLGCGPGGDALATVGGRELEMAPFQVYVSEVTGETWQAVSARVSSRLLDQYLDRWVVLEGARRRGVHVNADSIVVGPSEVQWLLDELCDPAPEPSADEIEEEVARRIEVEQPARAHVRQLLVDTQEEGVEAGRRLAAGEDFVDVSRSLSRAPNADDGGELGFFDQGSLPPEIDKVIFALAPGTFSDPVQGPSGYHVFQVLEVLPAGTLNRAQVEAAVRLEYEQRSARERVQLCVQQLASEIGVEIYAAHLWFPYSGRYTEGE
jgi:peptidyl-prolyl cis-trans isomerase C